MAESSAGAGGNASTTGAAGDEGAVGAAGAAGTADVEMAIPAQLSSDDDQQ